MPPQKAQNSVDQTKILHILTIYAAVIVLTAIIAFICPGNAHRYTAEMQNWFPNFVDLSVFAKTELGIAHAGAYLFYCFDVSTILFMVCLAYIVYRKYDNLIFRLMALLPLVVRALPLFCPAAFFRMDNAPIRKYTQFKQTLMVITDSGAQTNFGLLIISLLFFCLIFAVIVMAFWRESRLYAILVLYGTGLLTALAIAFSPTVIASSTRVFFPFHMVIIAVTVVCLFHIHGLWLRLRKSIPDSIMKQGTA